MYEIKKLDVLSCAKLYTLFSAIFCFIAGLIIFLIPKVKTDILGFDIGMGLIGQALGLTIGALILGAILGFIGGAICALIYNLVTKWVGGIRLDIVQLVERIEKVQPAVPSQPKTSSQSTSPVSPAPPTGGPEGPSPKTF